MSNAPDITTPDDVRLFVEVLYAKLLKDEVLAHHFRHLDLPSHLPRIAAFWEMVLFGARGFESDVMGKHLAIDRERAITAEHMHRWLHHFHAALDEHYSGPNVELAKDRARNIGALMLVKLRAN
ncbi:MAG: group III truncated hemoglobin [Flavobacteriales bacterium]|nr:group III truncated hemoglobin [Flavobacteriales bacterium]